VHLPLGLSIGLPRRIFAQTSSHAGLATQFGIYGQHQPKDLVWNHLAMKYHINSIDA